MLGNGSLASFPLAALPLTVASGITVSGTISSPLILGSNYTSAAFTASGGTSPYTWSAIGLPTGLSINATTGVVSGTPSTAGSYSVVVTATDALSATGSSSPISVSVIALPSFQYDFPNPRWAPRAIDLRTWTQSVPLALYTGTLANYMAVSKLLGYAILQPAPLWRFQQDWPNPLRPRYATELRTWINLSNPNLPPTPVPFFGMAGPNPVHLPFRTQEFIISSNFLLLNVRQHGQYLLSAL